MKREILNNPEITCKYWKRNVNVIPERLVSIFDMVNGIELELDDLLKSNKGMPASKKILKIAKIKLEQAKYYYLLMKDALKICQIDSITSKTHISPVAIKNSLIKYQESFIDMMMAISNTYTQLQLSEEHIPTMQEIALPTIETYCNMIAVELEKLIGDKIDTDLLTDFFRRNAEILKELYQDHEGSVLFQQYNAMREHYFLVLSQFERVSSVLQNANKQNDALHEQLQIQIVLVQDWISKYREMEYNYQDLHKAYSSSTSQIEEMSRILEEKEALEARVANLEEANMLLSEQISSFSELTSTPDSTSHHFNPLTSFGLFLG